MFGPTEQRCLGTGGFPSDPPRFQARQFRRLGTPLFLSTFVWATLARNFWPLKCNLRAWVKSANPVVAQGAGGWAGGHKPVCNPLPAGHLAFRAGWLGKRAFRLSSWAPRACQCGYQRLTGSSCCVLRFVVCRGGGFRELLRLPASSPPCLQTWWHWGPWLVNELPPWERFGLRCGYGAAGAPWMRASVRLNARLASAAPRLDAAACSFVGGLVRPAFVLREHDGALRLCGLHASFGFAMDLRMRTPRCHT